MKTFLWLLVIGVGATVVLFQQRTRASLKTSIAALASRSADDSQLVRERERLAGEQPTSADLEMLQKNHAELLQLRAELAKVESETTATTEARPTDAEPYPVTKTGSVFNPKVVGTSDLKLKDAWRNVGIDTPAAAFETHCWAEQGGDIDVLASTLLIDDAARIKAEEILNRMPAADRAKFGTLDQFIAMLRVGSGTAFEGIKVLDVIERRPGEVVLRTLWQYGDGRVRENTNVVLRQTPEGWKRPMPAGMVEQLYQLHTSGWTLGKSGWTRPLSQSGPAK